MALNQFMHPRNIYKDNPPNFKELGDRFPSFKKHVRYSASGKPFVDFRQPEVVRCLSVCLFEKDFNLKVELPPDRLAPTLPLRLNYLLWLQDLVGCLPKCNDLTVLDIGCGSSCVYPLLGCTLDQTWKFEATEVNEKNMTFAQKNVENNNLTDRITISHVTNDTPLLGVEFDACMCNPPFFTDDDVIKPVPNRPTPNSSNSGSACEIVGGDFLYAERMFQESLKLKDRRPWYTIMIGKKSSFIKTKELLHHDDVKTIAFTEFCQGRTMRWGVAWSFKEIDISALPQVKPKKKRKKKLLRFPSKFLTINETLDCIKGILTSLSIEYLQQEFVFTLKGNVCAGMPNRKSRRLARLPVAAESEVPAKKLKVDNFASEFECVLSVLPAEFGPALIELTSRTELYSDLLNRFYLYVRERL